MSHSEASLPNNLDDIQNATLGGGNERMNLEHVFKQADAKVNDTTTEANLPGVEKNPQDDVIEPELVRMKKEMVDSIDEFLRSKGLSDDMVAMMEGKVYAEAIARSVLEKNPEKMAEEIAAGLKELDDLGDELDGLDEELSILLPRVEKKEKEHKEKIDELYGEFQELLKAEEWLSICCFDWLVYFIILNAF